MDTDSSLDRITQLEERLARIEARLGLAMDEASGANGSMPAPSMPETAAPTPAESIAAVAKVEDEREFEVGQTWFAKAGILALTIGIGFMLSLPHASVPAALPSVAGFVAVAALFGVIYLARKSLELVAIPLRGAGMVLLFFSTLRLSFPLSRHVLDFDSWAARAFLVAVVAINLWIALRHKSPWLTGIALATGGFTAAMVNVHWLGFGSLILLVIIAVAVSERENWRTFSICAMVGSYATYLVWALGLRWDGAALHFATSPVIAPALLLDCTLIFAVGRWWGSQTETEDAWASVHAFINCALGYGVFFVHTIAAFPEHLLLAHTLAFVLFLGIAIGFWLRRQSHVATFFYAMTGYAALSVAIIKAFPVPTVFVWLSMQSVVVVATAIWFRSRFIVVANFLIYVGIVLTYVIVAERETGISLGFGVVSLVSARILNWQKERLELKTELMRNAYLVSAFVIFPYALAHLVSGRYVALTWVGLASIYYLLNLFVHSQKYRWMGHGTLGLAAAYAVIAGVSAFDPVYRVLTFLVLGTVLLIVAVSFNRALRRRSTKLADDNTSRAGL